VDPRVGHQIRLELVEIDVEGAVESKRGRDGGDDLGDETVEIGVRGPADVQVGPTDVVYSLHHTEYIYCIYRYEIGVSVSAR